MKQRLFACLRSCDHGADLSRRVASVSGNLWVLATDLRWLTQKGKKWCKSPFKPPESPNRSRFLDGGRLHGEAEKEMFFSFTGTVVEGVQKPEPGTCSFPANSSVFSLGERDHAKWWPVLSLSTTIQFSSLFSARSCGFHNIESQFC